MTPEELSLAVKEFKDLYREVFGIELDENKATKKAQDLLQLMVCLTEGKPVE
jgi:peroxiredoxin